jgi:hypothetical protein
MSVIKKIPPNIYRIGYQVLAVLAFISLKLLFDDNVGMTNEVDILPIAKQFADPDWIPQDWYLNQAPGYRFLFTVIFGNLAAGVGLFATSILGRLLCYSLVALGLVLIGRSLGLKLPLLLVAIGLFLYVNPVQGMAAQEWLVKSLEAKAVAYGLVLLAIFCLLRRYDRPMALLLGFATSFHVLVGGWATLIVLAKLVLAKRLLTKPDKARGRYHWLELGLIYIFASAFAIPPTLSHLFAESSSGEVSASFIYVFLRLSHHLNPLTWGDDWLLIPLAYLLVLFGSMAVLRRSRLTQPVEQYRASVDLFQLTLLSLIPFGLGVLIAPFDQQGSWLQYYPFRVGDVLLPLSTCLLLVCAIQQGFAARRRIVQWVAWGLVALACSIQLFILPLQIANLGRFPLLDAEFIALTDWVKTQTPADAVVVSPPVDFVEFSLLTERGTIAKYKLLPQTETKILQWYDRLADLNGGSFPQFPSPRTQDIRSETRYSLTEGYNRLNTDQAKALMSKYAAGYLMTRANHQLGLPVAYQNDRYVLYAAPN